MSDQIVRWHRDSEISWNLSLCLRTKFLLLKYQILRCLEKFEISWNFVLCFSLPWRFKISDYPILYRTIPCGLKDSPPTVTFWGDLYKSPTNPFLGLPKLISFQSCFGLSFVLSALDFWALSLSISNPPCSLWLGSLCVDLEFGSLVCVSFDLEH